MKFLVIFGILCIVGYSTQVSLLEGCSESVETLFNKESCMHVQCENFKNETVTLSKMSAHSCPIPECKEGEYKGNTPVDNTKVYPDCCATAICE